MIQPPGMIRGDPTKVCKLTKALYGLKQAPRAWFEKLSTFLRSLGFQNARADSSLFVYHNNNITCYILVYVDDIVITGNSQPVIDNLVSTLHQIFSLKDLGALSLFFGIEVSYTAAGSLLLSQQKYISDLLHKTKMSEANSISTPMVSGPIISAFHGEKFTDIHLYRSTVGALQYVTLTRPEIAYSVNKVCQFMHAPTHYHWQAVKRILRYLQGTLDRGLVFTKSKELCLEVLRTLIGPLILTIVSQRLAFVYIVEVT